MSQRSHSPMPMLNNQNNNNNNNSNGTTISYCETDNNSPWVNSPRNNSMYGSNNNLFEQQQQQQQQHQQQQQQQQQQQSNAIKLRKNSIQSFGADFNGFKKQVSRPQSQLYFTDSSGENGPPASPQVGPDMLLRRKSFPLREHDTNVNNNNSRTSVMHRSNRLFLNQSLSNLSNLDALAGNDYSSAGPTFSKTYSTASNSHTISKPITINSRPKTPNGEFMGTNNTNNNQNNNNGSANNSYTNGVNINNLSSNSMNGNSGSMSNLAGIGGNGNTPTNGANMMSGRNTPSVFKRLSNAFAERATAIHGFVPIMPAGGGSYFPGQMHKSFNPYQQYIY